MILLCVNELAGPTGYHKSVVELANGLHRTGYEVTVLSFFGNRDASNRMLPSWPLDAGIAALPLQTLAPDGGRLLHRNYHPELTATLGAASYPFTANQLAALRALNATLTDDDTIIFTAPVPAYAFHHAIHGDERRARTVLQIHNDYHFHEGLWNMLMESRDSIDRLQTVSSGLRAQFVPTFDDADVRFVPNFPGESTPPLERTEHEGINVALPASFQPRKNQLDAVRALAEVPDDSVHLTFWGRANNAYGREVRQLVEELGLEERVHLPGFGTERDVYSTADIILMTSLSEGLPFPLIEAAYHGLPTVTYDFEFGPRDAIIDGESGFIVPMGAVDEVADRVSRLAADRDLRARFGARAREVYQERFATEQVARQYRELLGDAAGAGVDLAGTFDGDGQAPVPREAIALQSRGTKATRTHRITVSSPVQLYDVLVDDGTGTRPTAVHREHGTTVVEFRGTGHEVVSYTTSAGSPDRHYLASTSETNELEVLAYLRRDADYGAGSPPAQDAIFATAGGLRRLERRELAPVVGRLATKTVRDVVWKLRHLRERPETAAPDVVAVPVPPAAAAEGETAGTTPASAPVSTVETAPSADVVAVPGTVAVATVATPEPAAPPALPPLARGVLEEVTPEDGVAAAVMRAARRMASSYAKSTATSIVGLAAKPGAPTRREIPRHPRFPISSGVDSFGAPINEPGGVQVRNAGSPARPVVFIKGEYDSLVLRDAASERTVTSPFGYGELFERICAAEREHGLFDIQTSDGVHVWELGRSALVIQLAESLGLWGSAPAVGEKVNDIYDGPKRLTTAPAARRVVFDYIRRGQSDYRTAAYRDDETMFVVQPEPGGYPEVDDTNMVYPFHEFNRWRQDWRRRWAHQRIPEVDARPFEAALTDALGIKVDLGDHLRNRLVKFVDERDFWTPVFERIQPEEVLIASSHWWAGISAAAQRSGAKVSDIQYALTSHYAPSFWFGDLPRYGASRFYAWSDMWASRTNVYQDHVVVPRQQEEFLSSGQDDLEPIWDVVVISQPRVLRRIIAFLSRVVRERPELRVVIAPHPAQRPLMEGALAAAGLTGKVTIAPDDTLTTIRQSRISVGCFSTSLWESAALGRPTFVIEVPGYEETLQDVESGLFRIAHTPHDLVEFEVPSSRRQIFGSHDQ